MHVFKSEAFVRETEEQRLAFCCEDCMHFDEDAGTCGIFFRTEPHRRERFDTAALGERLFFCKMFEAA